MATGTAPAPTFTLPVPSSRPGSASFADVYGALPGFGPTTRSAGGEGAARESAAARSGGAPITVHGIGPDFLMRPAGALVVGLAVLAAWSYFDR